MAHVGHFRNLKFATILSLGHKPTSRCLPHSEQIQCKSFPCAIFATVSNNEIETKKVTLRIFWAFHQSLNYYE